jgi:hypothetical protein
MRNAQRIRRLNGAMFNVLLNWPIEQTLGMGLSALRIER